MVGARLAGQAGVDHDPHARHGERGLGDGGGQHHPPPLARGQRRVLHRLRCAAVQLEHVGRCPGEQSGDAGDLADAGQEAEDVPVAFAEGPPDGGGDVVEQRRVDPGAVRGADAARRRRPDRLDRVGDPVRLNHLGAAEQVGPGGGVGGGGGADDAQLGPERGPDVEQEGERGVRVEVPLVALVQHDEVDAGQLLVALEALEQHAGGDHLDHGPRPGPALAAHGVADLVADGGAEQPGHPPGRGPDGEPARFGDEHPAGGAAVPEEAGQGERHQRGLAGAGRRGQHRHAVNVERAVQGGQGSTDGQLAPGRVHPHSLPDGRAPGRPAVPAARCCGAAGAAGAPARPQSRSATKIAVPGISRPRSGDQPPHSCSCPSGHSGSTRSTSRNPAPTSSRTRSPTVRWCST